MAIKASHNLGLVKWNNKHKFITNHVGTVSFYKTHHHKISKPIGCLSKLTQTQSFTVMEDPKRSSLSSLQPTHDLEIAVRAVQMACSLCQKVQDSLVSKSGAVVQSKDDNSPVTVAGLFLHFYILLWIVLFWAGFFCDHDYVDVCLSGFLKLFFNNMINIGMWCIALNCILLYLKVV